MMQWKENMLTLSCENNMCWNKNSNPELVTERAWLICGMTGSSGQKMIVKVEVMTNHDRVEEYQFQ